MRKNRRTLHKDFRILTLDLLVLALGQQLRRPGHGLPDQIPLTGIKIVDRTAPLGQLPEFRFRCQIIGSFFY